MERAYFIGVEIGTSSTKAILCDLEGKIQDLGSVQSVYDIAQEELGLVNPDTVVFQP